MKNGLFEVGDRVDHKRLGYVGAVVAVYANGDLCVGLLTPPVSPEDLAMVNEKAIQDAFDLGFKAAGGTMIPDGARDRVELSLTRDQLEILAAFADNVVDDPADRNHDSAPILREFLETISIHRRK